MTRRAILSVHDKAGLPAFGRGLARMGYELYSTGGTLRTLEEAAVDVRPITDLTGMPEMLGGRMKTLHPGVHGGILAKRDDPAQLASLEQQHLRTIDLVCVNLSPFAETAARPSVPYDDVVERIDVGGPGLIRSAAKNHRSVIVVVRPERYSEILMTLGREGDLDPDFRRRLAAEAFAQTAAYDARIASWLRREDPFPPDLVIAGQLAQHLRYGENPHQQAAFYRLGPDTGGLGSARQLQGAELSFNNLQDAAVAFAVAREFQRPAAAIVKHTNPCGVAVAHSLQEAYANAYDCDRESAVEGVVAMNRPLDRATAERIAPIVVEVVLAPSVDEDAAAVLAEKSKVRVLAAGPVRTPGMDVRAGPGGFLVQTWDRRGFDREACRVITEKEPTDEEWDQLSFAWLVVKHVKSRAVVCARGSAAVGIGAGQMSEVDAAVIATHRAGDRAHGAVMASDAYIASVGAVEEGLRAGVTAIIQPGGSVRDAEMTAAANRARAAMVMTGERHFRH